jgi:hypothetical protein
MNCGSGSGQVATLCEHVRERLPGLRPLAVREPAKMFNSEYRVADKEFNSAAIGIHPALRIRYLR